MLLFEYAPGFLPSTSASFFDVRKARPGYFTPYPSKHRRKKVEKSCVTLLLSDPGWYVHKPDVQNNWDDNKHTNTFANFVNVRKSRPEYFTPYLMLLSEYALGFLPTTSASFFDVRKARPGYFTPYPMLLSEYAIFFFFFCRLLLHAFSMYEKLAQGTLHPNPMLLCEYALGFLQNATSFYVRKTSETTLQFRKFLTTRVRKVLTT